MNARTLVREVSDELTLGIIDDQEFKALTQETLSVLNGDSVIREHFSENLSITGPLLAAPPKLVHKEENKAKIVPEEQEKYRHLRFAVEDFRAALENNYFRYLCDALEKSVKPDNEDEIRSLTGALLSDLVDREWPLESLFRWHNHFLTQRNHTFQENLSFMLRLLKRESQSFEVTLRLSGTRKVGQIGKHGIFTISADPGLTPQGSRETNFCKKNLYVSFGKATVNSVDATAAAIKARMEFQQLLDLLRFEFERGVVTVDQTSHVRRDGDGKSDLCVVRHTVPNPMESLDHEDFFEFAQRIDCVLTSNSIEANSKRRLQAAIRQYRFGRDKEGYEDKFLNWWTGLESLCYGGQGGGIGKVVACPRFLYQGL
jgi:hypothetical protein